ncbi:hypothetical protein CSOJ01_00963 [Colletotrichum sojae]|uniref:Uncharacterized protein n=1 Tax=Colletotrichum sojae TaxID=2175907 RepID=A0A8H6JWV1_9PEZI|nr:hypothetical protein CSOJ01_00963 [Colletotrichum sojae]
MAVASSCAHSFKMIKSDSTLIQWTCNLCHSERLTMHHATLVHRLPAPPPNRTERQTTPTPPKERGRGAHREGDDAPLATWGFCIGFTPGMFNGMRPHVELLTVSDGRRFGCFSMTQTPFHHHPAPAPKRETRSRPT